MPCIHNVYRSISVDTDSVRSQQAAFRVLDAFAENTDDGLLLRIIADDAGILVVGDDHMIVLIDGKVLGRIELRLESFAKLVAGFAGSCHRLNLSVCIHSSKSVTTAFQNIQIVLITHLTGSRPCA